MTKHFHLQYEDVASTRDWRTDRTPLNPRYMAISADSHVTEPPEAYSRFIDPKFRDVAPRLVPNPKGVKSEYYLAEGMPAFSFRTSAAAGLKPQEIDLDKGAFEDMHKGGWDPVARLADQDRDGILAEVIYPTIGMLLCGHPDADYKHACFNAYNQWICEFTQTDTRRLFAVGQSAVRSVKDAIEDLHRIKALGLKGVMLPSEPSCDGLDYDAPEFDALWKTAIELEMPISFHVLTGRGPHQLAKPPRGGVIAGFGGIIRELQDVVSLFIFGRVFERHPDLKMVLVESDAGWAPHFCSRMDHAYKRHRFWMKVGELSKLPSEYFASNIWMTFQDDWVALRNLDFLNPRQLLWANDYPHSDSTWPWSHQVLEHHMAHLSDEQVAWILRDNVTALYGLDVEMRAPAVHG